MIRRARPDDEATIRNCAEKAYARYVAAIGRRPAPMLADFAAAIAAGTVHVAVEDDRFQGFIIFMPEGDRMLLESVAVLPEAAGRGVGKALIGFCEAEALRRGLSAVHLYTNEKMTENLAIYPRLGYAEVARRTQDGFQRVFFEKRLAGPAA